MKLFRSLVTLGALLSSASVIAQSAPSPESQLKVAINRDVVEGDYRGAIELYRDIVAKYPANKPVASKALLHLAGLYERQGRPEARSTYERIVADYGDSGATATAARARLATIQQMNAGPFKTRDLDSYLKDGGTGSPDGKFIAYVRNSSKTVTRNGKPVPVRVLAVRDLSNGRERVIVEPKEADHVVMPFPFWSPDGLHLAYRMATSEKTLERRVVTVATRESRLIGDAVALLPMIFTWSPNSQYLLMGTSTNPQPIQIELATLASGTVQRVGPSTTVWSTPVWSPDSTQFAYVAAVAGAPDNKEIRVTSTAGTSIRTLPVPPLGAGGQTNLSMWTPDDRILFSQTLKGTNDFFATPVRGGETRQICEGRGNLGGDGCQGFSPDGMWQITRKNLSGGGRIVLRNTVDGTERPLTPEAVMEQTLIGFSPDSRLFAFRSNRDGRPALYVVPIDRIPVSNPVKITPLQYGDGSLNSMGGWWTPTGLVLRIDDTESNLFRVDVDPGTGRPASGPVRLTQDSPTNRSPFTSPDGRQIAYIRRGGADSGFAIMEANGSSERLVRTVPPDVLGGMALLGWRTDEELLIADAGFGTGGFGTAPKTLKTVNVRDGDITTLAGVPVLGPFLQFVPSTNEVFYALNGTLTSRPLLGDTARETALHKDRMWHLVSPDGGTVVYGTAGYGADGKKMSVTGDVRIRPVVGTDERIVVTYSDAKDGARSPAGWSPDGRHLLYADQVGDLRILSLGSGQSWPLLTDKPASVDFDRGVSGHWSRDGRYIVMEGSTSETSWRALDGVTYDAVVKLMTPRK